MNRLLLPYALLLAILSASCRGSGGDIPVPRPQAYPRIAIPDSVFRPVSAGDVTLQLNAAVDSLSARGSLNGSWWITALYDDFDASLFITVTPLSPADALSTIDNRVERLSLNTGGLPTEVTSFTTSAGLDARIIVTPQGSPVPVQFLVTDHNTLLVSGSATLEAAATAPPDSIAPVIDMLRRDVTHTVLTISR